MICFSASLFFHQKVLSLGRQGFLWILVFWVIGCTGFDQADVRSSAPRVLEGQALIERLKRNNSDLKTFKGVGSLRLKNDGNLQTLRVAWMGESPEKLRIEALAISGQPMASFAGDGEWLYFLFHAEKKYYKKRYEKGFDQFLSIPVHPREMIALLSGKIPVEAHHTVDLINDPDSPGYILILKKRWQGIVEKIYLDSEKQEVLKIECFDGQGALSFRVQRDQFQAVTGFNIPFLIHASDNDGSFFELTVQRCWTNVPVDPEGFAIYPKAG